MLEDMIFFKGICCKIYHCQYQSYHILHPVWLKIAESIEYEACGLNSHFPQAFQTYLFLPHEYTNHIRSLTRRHPPHLPWRVCEGLTSRRWWLTKLSQISSDWIAEEREEWLVRGSVKKNEEQWFSHVSLIKHLEGYRLEDEGQTREAAE